MKYLTRNNLWYSLLVTCFASWVAFSCTAAGWRNGTGLAGDLAESVVVPGAGEVGSVAAAWMRASERRFAQLEKTGKSEGNLSWTEILFGLTGIGTAVGAAATARKGDKNAEARNGENLRQLAVGVARLLAGEGDTAERRGRVAEVLSDHLPDGIDVAKDEV